MRPKDAELARALEHPVREKLVLLPLFSVWKKLLLCERPDSLAELLMLLGERLPHARFLLQLFSRGYPARAKRFVHETFGSARVTYLRKFSREGSLPCLGRPGMIEQSARIGHGRHAAGIGFARSLLPSPLRCGSSSSRATPPSTRRAASCSRPA